MKLSFFYVVASGLGREVNLLEIAFAGEEFLEIEFIEVEVFLNNILFEK